MRGNPPDQSWRHRLHEIIFEAETPAGKTFDLLLILAILLSTITVLLESVPAIRVDYGSALRLTETIFTVLFTVEYFFRIIAVRKPGRYIFSFYGLVDLLAILPTYISIILPGGQYFLALRALRMLRVFRVMKLALYLREGELLLRSLRASKRKIVVFLLAVLNLVIILGSVMYLIEGEANGFTSIPKSVYWAVVTLTTVGYGDIAPQTNLGQFLAAIVMMLGYAIIAVPTGIVTAEMIRGQGASTESCPSCGREGHDSDASYCKWCGTKL